MAEDKKSPKGIAALIIAKKKPEGGMMENDDSEGPMMAIEDMMQALDERDPEMFKSALDAYLDMR